MEIETRADALAVVRAVLAADFGCDEGTLQSEGITISTAAARTNGRRYPKPADFFEAATLGAGVVLHCPPSRATLYHQRLSDLDRPTAFGLSTLGWLREKLDEVGLDLWGPSPIYVCGRRELVPIDPPSGVEISVVQADRISSLYGYPEFLNALGYGKTPAIPDMLATVATRQGEIVGMAGASADAETMWQIGIDVVPDARFSGIGAALVSRLAREVFAAGRLPYYAHGLTNVASAALAAKVGFRQAWIEIYARERAHPAPALSA